MELEQIRAGRVEVGDYLPNLGQVTKIHCADWGIRFTFKDSATRQFEPDRICYVVQREKKGTRWGGDNAKPSARDRAKSVRGVTVE